MGFSFSVTNADSVEDLEGPFTTFVLEAPFLSMQLSVGRTASGRPIFQASHSLPRLTVGRGLLFSIMQTRTDPLHTLRVRR